MSFQGVVVDYKPEKGYGFIKAATFERDIFFHISDFYPEGLPTRGLKVTFDLKDNADEKKSACNINFLQASEESQSKDDAQRNKRKLLKENSAEKELSAYVSVREDGDTTTYVGTIKLTERQLHFAGNYWMSTKSITRSLRFITSVETHLFDPYTITGGGPKLFVQSANIFFRGDIKKIISALKTRR